MRDYHLHELIGDDFENLVIHLCREVLGTGTVNFSTGPDGGRDGRFEGMANSYPSQVSPWKGKFIIQAKCVANPTASCADASFKTVLKKELPKIKKLRTSKECDIYLIFTNRKLSANVDKKLRKFIKDATQVSKVGLIGLETITSYLDAHKNVVTTCGLERFRGPLRIQPEELREVIVQFHSHRSDLSDNGTGKYAFDHVELETKNQINTLRQDYFRYIESNSQSYFHQIDAFLKNPVNRDLQDMFSTVADEIQSKLLVKREQFEYFEEVFLFLYDQILEVAPDLKPKRRLVNVFLHYMYCNCDIGKKQ